MIELNFYNDYNKSFDYLKTDYSKIFEIALKILNINKKCEISVTLVNNEEIQRINKEYRNKDYATDVISFESGMLLEEFHLEVDLGDIFISVDKALEQAKEYGHSQTRELNFLFVHGLLHCLGYDHLNELDEKEMFAMQEVILDDYKL
ncbi:rRNA maturation RNase YbeY [Mycoplasma sp. P36-A1]|uniref:rRNA maturation RNase YbeY n=1 Tax=Mycoplasma sp. P36-A1 TaxID=3252900 RepID=UPI003C2C3205